MTSAKPLFLNKATLRGCRWMWILRGTLFNQAPPPTPFTPHPGNVVQCATPMYCPPHLASLSDTKLSLTSAPQKCCSLFLPMSTGLSSTSFQTCSRLLSDTCDGSLSQINLAPQKQEIHRFTSPTSQAGLGVPKHAWGFTVRSLSRFVASLSPCRSSLTWLWVEPAWKGSTLPVSSGGGARGRFWFPSDHVQALEPSLWPEH